MTTTIFELKEEIIFVGFTTARIPKGNTLTVTTKLTPTGLANHPCEFTFSNGLTVDGNYDFLGRYVACGAIVQQG